MDKIKDTIDKAYGSIPNEVSITFDFFDLRPIRYFWLRWIVRKLFR